MPDFLPNSLLQAAPTLAMYQGIQNQQSDLDTADKKRQELAAIIQDMQQKTQQSAAMNPLLVQHQDLVNQGLQAGLPGIVGDAASHAAAGQVAQATIPSAIDEKNAESSSKVTKAASEKWQRLQSTLMQATPLVKQVDGTSPGAGMTALQTVMKQNGYSPESPEGQMVSQLFGGVPPGQLGTAMDHTANALLQLNPEYKKGIDEANIRGKAEVQSAGIHAAGQLAVANAYLEGGRWDKNKLSSDLSTQTDQLIQASKGDVAKQYAILNRAAVVASQSQNATLAQKFQEQAAALEPQVQAAYARANATPGAVNAGAITGMPTNPALSVQPPPLPGQGSPLPAQATPNPLAGSTAGTPPPPAAIQMLKQNPRLAAAFDAKYGQGASAKVLGQ